MIYYITSYTSICTIVYHTFPIVRAFTVIHAHVIQYTILTGYEALKRKVREKHRRSRSLTEAKAAIHIQRRVQQKEGDEKETTKEPTRRSRRERSRQE